MFIAALFNLPAQSLNCAARAESSVKISSIAVITGAALNVALDPVFMFSWGFGMGVEGASLATTISQCVTFVILAWLYLSGHSMIKVHPKYFKLSGSFLWAVTAIGIPTAFIQICLAVATSLTNIAAKPLPDSDLIIAAYGVVQRLILIGCYVVMGFMQGYQPVASYAFGVKDEDRFHDAVRFALKGALLLTVVVAAAYIILAQPLIMLFNRNPMVIEFGRRLLISQVALLPCFWSVLYDDHYLPDHRRFQNGSVPFHDPAGTLLCALHSGAAQVLWRDRDLRRTTRRRSVHDSGMRILRKTHEADGLRAYGRKSKQAVIQPITAKTSVKHKNTVRTAERLLYGPCFLL